MKLLLDENLSFRLAKRIEDLFPESTHVFQVGLAQAPDTEIWKFAQSNGFAIVSADADFYELATKSGPPPKVIWLRGCDCPTAVVEQIVRTQSIRIMDFLNDADRAVLVLRVK